MNITELFNYKDLFLTLSFREFRIRYAQTLLGFLWAFLQPFLTLIIFSFIFGKAIQVDTGNIPYPVFAMTGITAWTYFAFLASQAGKSIITEQGMIKKIYFPRLIIPFSRALVGMIDFLISFILMIVLLAVYQVQPSWNMLWLPVFILMIIVSGLTVGVWVSSLTIRYRDLQHIIPFVIQIGLFATPVAYSANYIPEKYMFIYYLLNPMAGIVEGFRWCILGVEMNHFYFLFSFILLLFLFFGGLFYFKKTERIMADIL